MKKKLGFLVLLVVVVGLFLTGCGNSSAAPVSDFRFEVVGNGVRINSYSGDGVEGKLVIPGKINGVPVTTIGAGEGAIGYLNKLVSVTIPDSVTEIEDKAFVGASMMSVKLSKNLKRIGVSAFASCKNLTSINIPSSVTEIGKYAFWKCDNLNEKSFKAIQAVGYDFNEGTGY